ncbi:MAG: nucleotidyltransferase domain-containing protein [Acidimicrobiia bacterium]|nr:nucleotidyltransferase domain-containing protein [Acidimicrobiia bacterium]MYF25880.1 nucleotidyltransferase domain-containing protein [Acidimicrobiia bacterium]
MNGYLERMTETEWAFDDPWPTLDDALEAAEVVADRARKLFGDELVEVLLYGSRARGDHCPESDLDILLVTKSEGEERPNRLQEQLDNSIFYEMTVQCFIWSLVSIRTASVNQVRNWDTTFYRNVRAEAIGVP